MSGCITLNDPEASQEYISDPVGEISTGSTLGQTLVSRRPHLNGITIWVTTRSAESGGSGTSPAQIKLDLYHSSEDSVPIYSSTISVPVPIDNTALTFTIPSQKNPAGESFYVLLSSGGDMIQVNGRNEDAYPYGQAFSNNAPINADIAFHLSYDYGFAAFGQDLIRFLGNVWITLPILVLLWLPGWMLLDISGLRLHFDAVEQAAISIGISLGLIPVLLLWTSVLKLHWSQRSAYFISGFLVALSVTRLLYRYLSFRKSIPPASIIQSDPDNRPSIRSYKRSFNPSILMILIFMGTLAIRFIMVRDLGTPAWVDSVHHALITRLILQDGAYPSTYLPYLNISSIAYHPGFHSVAAFFTWLSGLDLSRSLLIIGQVLNVFAIFSVYLLATTLTRSSMAGVFAAFITGFLTPMPAYYTSWGRYTELTGLLLFPVVLALIHSWKSWGDRKTTAWIIFLSAITAGGLFMIHYRVVLFLGCLLIAYLCVRLFIRDQDDTIKFPHLFYLILAIAGAGILIVLPWLIPTIKDLLIPRLTTSVINSITAFEDFSWPYLTSALGKQALVLAALGFLWSLIKQRSLPFVIFLWVAILFFLANLGALNLPGSTLVTNLSVEIILFIPISILGGFFLEQLLVSWKQFVPPQIHSILATITLIIFSFVAYLGAKQLIPILNPVTILSRQADLPAIQWVNDHLPADATLVVNPFPWGYGLYAGNDGGYWIEPLSGRFSLPPPVLYGLAPGYKQISQQSQQVVASSKDPLVFHDYLVTQSIQYIFIGARGGVIPPNKLVESGLFDPLYHQDGAWVLAVKP